MKKILIPLCIILAVYIGYDTFSNKNSSETTISKTDQPKEKIKVYPFEPEIELPNVDTNPLLGDYSAEVKNDKLTASLTLSLMEGNKISHSRSINRSGVITEGEVTGEYIIKGNLLNFTFPEMRDKEVFPMEMLILTIAKDNSISSGQVKFTKL
ncbi:hypothetical protein NBRC116592_05940 [Colwellia sp. KU-HH00111]|uniref:hypothetical protein n=1 Tax=Colwellia sp. KU-HH00111 TaxID=3127652 RepID=UPI0031057A58